MPHESIPVRPGRFWGDESHIVRDVFEWAANRVVLDTDPKTTARPASELKAEAGQTITPEGIGGAEAMRVFTEVLAPSTRAQDDPMNLAYIPAAPTRSAIAFDMATSAANIFGGLWEAGAGAIFAENEALAWLIDLLKWPDTASGVFAAGGTMGNLSALHAARASAKHKRIEAGLSPKPEGGWAIACAASSHSSISNAADVLDVDVIWVEENSDGRLDGPGLRAAIGDQAERVFAVSATAGSTNAGIVDDLASIADYCGEFGIWLHVDGAYGGAGLCAPSLRDRYVGIERANSMIVDPHKWLFAPYDCCALIYRDARDARAAHTQVASYLDTIDREAPNPSDLAIHLSRRARGLPFWFSLATHGTDAYVAAVEQTVKTAHEVADWIKSAHHLTLLREPDLTVLLFEHVGWGPEDYMRWSRRMALEGDILCLPTKWHGRVVLRLAFVNPATKASDVKAVLEHMPL